MIDRRVCATTPRFAVLGESLSHTWSPFIHNSLFAAANIEAIYLPVTIPRAKLSSAVDVLRSCFAGFNVTIPYKERIIPMLDSIDEAARACGAVNTVENRNGRLIGHITDGLGMLRAIREAGIAVDRQDVLILGGGGAARVAGYEFLRLGGRVTFAVRDTVKGAALAAELGDTQPDGTARIGVCSLDGVSGAHDVLVNCTPVGMYPHVQACPVGEETIRRCAAVFDAVYNPRMTQLIQTAQRNAIPIAEGLGMLFYQAAEAQRFWFDSGTVASEAMQRQVYQELLEQM
ncbi:MAG: shikimate dehydrogenase [Clostridia bacterium]|nr:shikimate dehydrogenase [Clostridia bacterium]